MPRHLSRRAEAGFLSEGPRYDGGRAATKPSVACAVLCGRWQAVRAISARRTPGRRLPGSSDEPKDTQNARLRGVSDAAVTLAAAGSSGGTVLAKGPAL